MLMHNSFAFRDHNADAAPLCWWHAPRLFLDRSWRASFGAPSPQQTGPPTLRWSWRHWPARCSAAPCKTGDMVAQRTADAHGCTDSMPRRNSSCCHYTESLVSLGLANTLRSAQTADVLNKVNALQNLPAAVYVQQKTEGTSLFAAQISSHVQRKRKAAKPLSQMVSMACAAHQCSSMAVQLAGDLTCLGIPASCVTASSAVAAYGANFALLLALYCL